MGIFDDVVVNAKSAAQTVGKMAGQFVDMSKLRINMAELNGEITKRYQGLGRFIYEAKKAGSADEAELADQIAGIDDLYAQLSAVSAQYASMQDKVTCPACGKKMPTDSMFCSHCGAKLENAPAEPEEAAEAVEKAEVPAEPETTEVTIETEKTAGADRGSQDRGIIENAGPACQGRKTRRKEVPPLSFSFAEKLF